MKLVKPLNHRIARILNWFMGLPPYTVHVRLIDIDKPVNKKVESKRNAG